MLGLWEYWLRVRLNHDGMRPHNEQEIWLLSDIPDAEGLQNLVNRLREAGRTVTLIGWRPPERNLDFPAWLLFRVCLFACSQRQRARCRAFLQNGGVEGLAVRSGLRVESRKPLLGGAAVRIRLAEKAGAGYAA